MQQSNIMPGFRPAIGFTLVYLSLIVLIPLSAMLLKTMQLSLDDYWTILTNQRVLASFRVSFISALIAAGVAVVFGFIIAWSLVRYPFPGKRVFDALIDLPFALPTAVAGIVLAAIYEPKGWIGKIVMDYLDIQIAYKPLGIVFALIFIGLPFVVRTIEPGEVVVMTRAKSGEIQIDSHFPFPRRKARPCLFEFVYFSRPDSTVDGRSVYEIRKRMGMRLAQETGVEADVIVPVPDSGVPAAMGYAAESGLPYELGIVRSHYAGRTFIQPKQAIRDIGVRLKHAANRAVLKDKRVVLVDDSIVRGTTSQKIVQMVREAGAKEVHFRSA